jgi:hypothetical protein
MSTDYDIVTALPQKMLRNYTLSLLSQHTVNQYFFVFF